jgi:hypothetical protein
MGTMKVVLHGSLNKLMFKLNRKWIFSKSYFNFKIFLVWRFSKKVAYWIYLFCLIFSIRIILFGQMQFSQRLWLMILFCFDFVIEKNCKKSPMNIMLIPPNNKMLYIYIYIFCSFKCVVANKMQPTMDIWP